MDKPSTTNKDDSLTSTKSRKFYNKKRYRIPLIVIVSLIGLRLYLPFYVKSEVNKVLAELPGYYGKVEGIDISLLRGAYVIKGLYLNKVNAKTEVPFLNFPQTDISIEWKSLLKGEIVSEIIMNNPEVIYVMEDQQTDGETPNSNDWTKALTDLVPIDLNNFEIHNGKIAFVELQANPNIDLHFNQLELYAKNLRNVSSYDRTLPSPIHATATSIGNGNITFNGNINLIKEVPDMNIEFGLKKASVTSLNPFTKHYAGIDFESGTFELFSEIAIADGYMKGYMKPLVTDSKLISKEDSFLSVLWEGFVGFFKFILKNQSTDTLATKIPIEGNLNNVEAGILPGVINIFENAWIKAFKGAVDDEIEYEDAFKEKD
ncbi:DUF748 domain-containing protein [uncultured Winogradskyella sp.]|uniref:DUF748 domain-containing protein n=1 Tax=uncultured Winogradskyella sp. TaxID=395353 RepID=UPI00260CD357|nr:DUF748 domain-containing protein [uncultured Winogradskyella sp.]|tara:strand:+ start:565 stop:1686 length:1122 start_codon:yes stop_codon:yes gene_type:complete